MKFNSKDFTWVRPPKEFTITDSKIHVKTEPKTDLWQRTYYGMQNDNAPCLQMKTKEKFFSFVVKTDFNSKTRFDQCGVIMYLDSDNWFKASIEFENEKFQRLGSVVTNNGYSDWATMDIDVNIKSMWYRFSRRESDFYCEWSDDGKNWKQMRLFHMFKGGDEISFGLYACSPGDGSFDADFSNMELMECKWLPES